MLKTRIATALVLLTILGAVFSSHSFFLLMVVATLFFAAAMWESQRLFGSAHPVVGASAWVVAFVALAFLGGLRPLFLHAFCILLWALIFSPELAVGLPSLQGTKNRLLAGAYGVAVLGCFGAMLILLERSAVYLISVMSVVWVSDIGAYFVGKAVGKHKLAVSISPGKSWEGAIGGWCCVMALVSITLSFSFFSESFAVRVYTRFGWIGLVATMTVMVVMGVVGDLFESQLKRRISAKDSSNLLPGHGGVLDRIDALIPTLPFAVLLDSWI